MLTRSRSAYSTGWWAIFYTFCLVPMLVLSVGVGRYLYARAEMYKAADGAALAAAQEADVVEYLNSRRIVLLPSAYTLAEQYAAFNSDYLKAKRIYPRVTGIRVDQATRTVYVSLDADASDLFPMLRGLRVKGEGTAEVRFADQGGIGGGIAPSGGAVAPP